MEAVEEFAFQNVFVDTDEEDEDEDVTDTTSGDDGDKDDSFRRKKKLHKLRNLEKLNMFMEENAPIPEGQKKTCENVRVNIPPIVKEDLKENDSSADESSPSSIIDAWTVGKPGRRTKDEKEKDLIKVSESIGNSTNTTSEDILEASTSEKSFQHDQKREKGSSSPDSSITASVVKQDDKKLNYKADSSENNMCDSGESEGENNKDR